MEHVVDHGEFRLVGSAEKLNPQTPDAAKWKVLVSMWKMGDDAQNRSPEIIRVEDRRSADLGEALSDGFALAMRRIDERKT
jgi:hypothetical protein